MFYNVQYMASKYSVMLIFGSETYWTSRKLLRRRYSTTVLFKVSTWATFFFIHIYWRQKHGTCLY